MSLKYSNKTRYIGRKEYFGSLFFDSYLKRIFPFDHLATSIFECISEYSIPNIIKAFNKELSCEEIEGFIDCWKKEGLISKNNKLNGYFLQDFSQNNFLSVPSKIYMDFTSRCNLTCRHCVSSSTLKGNTELSTDKMKQLIKQLNEAGVFEINVGGGEPLIRDDAIELLDFAANAGMAVSLTTNTTLIDENMAKKLASIKLKYIAISLDGASSKTHDYIRGKGQFENILKTIAILSKYKSNHLNLHFTLMKHNLHELKTFFELTENQPVQSMGIVIIRPKGRARNNPELLLSKKEYKTSITEMINYSIISNKPSFVMPFLPGMKKGESGRLYSHFGCGAANVTCHIDSEGNMFPCNYFDYENSYKKDNVFKKSIQTIWCEGEFFKKLRNLKGNKKCLTCKHFEGCRGGCRAHAQYFYNNLNAPDYYCL